MITLSTESKARFWCAVLCGLALTLGCRSIEGPPAPPVSDSPEIEAQPTGAPIKPLRAGVHRGVCLAHSYQEGGSKGYGSQASQASKAELAELGVDWVSLTPFGWQRTLSTTRIELNPHSKAGESDRKLEEEVGQARELGMKVMMKPHLWINFNDWRGHIDPEGGEAGWRAWFESYTAFVLHYARLSERLGVDAFVIGLELASASPRREDWIGVIDAVRAVYSGPLIYAANWNEVEIVAFWDKVDIIGVQFFAPLSDSTSPSYEDLTRPIARHIDAYGDLSARVGKPVILTEFGYKSIKATTASPGTWPEHLPESAKAYDEANQALAYRALLAVVADRPFIQGVYAWKWFTDVHTREEGRIGFSPRGKAAAQVMGRAYAQQGSR